MKSKNIRYSLMHKAMKKKTKNKEDRKMNRRTGAFAFALALLLIVVYLAAAMPAPTLNFIDPTPANNSYQTADTVSSPSFDSSITILNPQSYPSIGENWTVRFNTTGQANLTITPVNNTYFGITPITLTHLLFKVREKFSPIIL